MLYENSRSKEKSRCGLFPSNVVVINLSDNGRNTLSCWAFAIMTWTSWSCQDSPPILKRQIIIWISKRSNPPPAGAIGWNTLVPWDPSWLGVANEQAASLKRFWRKQNTIRDGCSTKLYTVYTVYTVHTVQTALHCLNSGMFACISIFLRKVRTLLEWADGLLSKMLD